MHIMEIKFLEDGESPDIGAYQKGDIRYLNSNIANIFIQRGIAEELKPRLEPFPSKGEGKVRIQKKEEYENGRK